MQKPLQEYKRGLYGGYTSEATRKRGGDAMPILPFPTSAMDLALDLIRQKTGKNIPSPFSANPLDIVLGLSGANNYFQPQPSALPDYMTVPALNAIRTTRGFPQIEGAEEPQSVSVPSSAEQQPTRTAKSQPVAQGQEERPSQTASAMEKSSWRKLNNVWTQINTLAMSIPDVRRRQEFVAQEINRLMADGEINEREAQVLHNWNTSINVQPEQRRIDERLLWLLVISSLIPR